MKKFMILHVGFEKPTEEVMKAWKKWFSSIADRQLEQVGLMNGREVSSAGVRELEWDANCLTGYNIIEARSIEEAVELAEGIPFVTSARVYELR